MSFDEENTLRNIMLRILRAEVDRKLTWYVFKTFGGEEIDRNSRAVNGSQHYDRLCENYFDDKSLIVDSYFNYTYDKLVQLVGDPPKIISWVLPTVVQKWSEIKKIDNF